MVSKNFFCLGMAQFGKPYGAVNEKKQIVPDKDIKAIFRIMDKKKLYFLDTAIDYDDVDKRLNSIGISLKKI